MLFSLEINLQFGQSSYRLPLLAGHAAYHAGSAILEVVFAPKATQTSNAASAIGPAASIKPPSPSSSISSRCPALDSNGSSSACSGDEAEVEDKDVYSAINRVAITTPEPLIISTLPPVKGIDSPFVFQSTGSPSPTRPTRRLPTRPITRPLLTGVNVVALGTAPATREVGQPSNVGEGVRIEASAKDDLAIQPRTLPITKVAPTPVEELTTLLVSMHLVGSESASRTTSSSNSTIIDSSSLAPRPRHRFPHPPLLLDPRVRLRNLTREEREWYAGEVEAMEDKREELEEWMLWKEMVGVEMKRRKKMSRAAKAVADAAPQSFLALTAADLARKFRSKHPSTSLPTDSPISNSATSTTSASSTKTAVDVPHHTDSTPTGSRTKSRSTSSPTSDSPISTSTTSSSSKKTTVKAPHPNDSTPTYLAYPSQRQRTPDDLHVWRQHPLLARVAHFPRPPFARRSAPRHPTQPSWAARGSFVDRLGSYPSLRIPVSRGVFPV